jgi:hypothetical protein
MVVSWTSEERKTEENETPFLKSVTEKLTPAVEFKLSLNLDMVKSLGALI